MVPDGSGLDTARQMPFRDVPWIGTGSKNAIRCGGIARNCYTLHAMTLRPSRL